mmetsp:Transcript_16971/g.57385  ORF Transcript_16971/g.57385 Transcript_16971/m.57385 type:complete len:367 (+) Transcript_16971:72-1172(+)
MTSCGDYMFSALSGHLAPLGPPRGPGACFRRGGFGGQGPRVPLCATQALLLERGAGELGGLDGRERVFQRLWGEAGEEGVGFVGVAGFAEVRTKVGDGVSEIQHHLDALAVEELDGQRCLWLRGVDDWRRALVHGQRGGLGLVVRRRAAIQAVAGAAKRRRLRRRGVFGLGRVALGPRAVGGPRVGDAEPHAHGPPLGVQTAELGRHFRAVQMRQEDLRLGRAKRPQRRRRPLLRVRRRVAQRRHARALRRRGRGGDSDVLLDGEAVCEEDDFDAQLGLGRTARARRRFRAVSTRSSAATCSSASLRDSTRPSPRSARPSSAPSSTSTASASSTATPTRNESRRATSPPCAGRSESATSRPPAWQR